VSVTPQAPNDTERPTVSPAGPPRAAAATQPTAVDRLRDLPADPFEVATGFLELGDLGALRGVSPGMNRRVTANPATAAVFEAAKPDAPWRLKIGQEIATLTEKILDFEGQLKLHPNLRASRLDSYDLNTQIHNIRSEIYELKYRLARNDGALIADHARFGRIAAPAHDVLVAGLELSAFFEEFEEELSSPEPLAKATVSDLLERMAKPIETLSSRGEYAAIDEHIQSLFLDDDQKSVLRQALSELITKGPSAPMQRFLMQISEALDPATPSLDEGTPSVQGRGEFSRKLDAMLGELLDTLTKGDVLRDRMSAALRVITNSQALEDEMLAANLTPHEEVRSQLRVMLTGLSPEERGAIASSTDAIAKDGPPDALQPFLDDIRFALETLPRT
jgi:hypothetical protein